MGKTGSAIALILQSKDHDLAGERVLRSFWIPRASSATRSADVIALADVRAKRITTR